jgi:hypothetical protein
VRNSVVGHTRAHLQRVCLRFWHMRWAIRVTQTPGRKDRTVHTTGASSAPAPCGRLSSLLGQWCPVKPRESNATDTSSLGSSILSFFLCRNLLIILSVFLTLSFKKRTKKNLHGKVPRTLKHSLAMIVRAPASEEEVRPDFLRCCLQRAGSHRPPAAHSFVLARANSL